jgi:hypothetical protein
MQGSIKVAARPCELDNGSNSGRERDLVRWAKAISGPQSTVDTQDRLYDPDADAPL